MASLGQELKRERELRGISLQEIANTTKISMRFLQALEEDKLDILPGEFFIKSIISAYANTLGLEKDSVLNKYYETLLYQEQAQETEPIKRKPYPEISRNIKKFFGSSLLIVLLILFLLLIYFVFLKREAQPPPEDINTFALSQEVKQAVPPVPEPPAKPENDKQFLIQEK